MLVDFPKPKSLWITIILHDIVNKMNSFDSSLFNELFNICLTICQLKGYWIKEIESQVRHGRVEKQNQWVRRVRQESGT